ncbi:MULTISPECIES: hypothetical protein [Geomonas]|uniref:hypothetical protein n=1 Tax=Geomonas TaxID=2651583 RepID=UPI0018E08449|nr:MULTISPECIES: hypothetical protein [Geomonas]
MKKLTRILLALVVLPALLAGCILVPVDDGYYHGRHHGGGYYDYDGRYDRGGYYGRRY